MKETIGDIDILVIAESSKRIMDGFTSMDTVSEILARGDTKSSVVLVLDSVDLSKFTRIVNGAALHYFTGSKDHNIVIRDRASTAASR